MDAKKLIEGLPIEITGRDVSIGNQLEDLESVRRHATTNGMSVVSILNTLGWRVLLALMDEQEQPRDFFGGPEWDKDDWESESDAALSDRTNSLRNAVDYLLAKEKL